MKKESDKLVDIVDVRTKHNVLLVRDAWLDKMFDGYCAVVDRASSFSAAKAIRRSNHVYDRIVVDVMNEQVSDSALECMVDMNNGLVCFLTDEPESLSNHLEELYPTARVWTVETDGNFTVLTDGRSRDHVCSYMPGVEA